VSRNPASPISPVCSEAGSVGRFIRRNKIRFPASVPVDARVRGRAEVVSIDPKGDGWYEVVTRFTLEVEGNEKPCFVGDSVTRVMAPGS
jgi:acyl dehydratase